MERSRRVTEFIAAQCPAASLGSPTDWVMNLPGLSWEIENRIPYSLLLHSARILFRAFRITDLSSPHDSSFLYQSPGERERVYPFLSSVKRPQSFTLLSPSVFLSIFILFLFFCPRRRFLDPAYS